MDFLSMDIELGEPAALAGFDIERFAPELVCVEAYNAIREKVLEYFSTHEYVKHERYSAYDDGQNWYFTRGVP